jgi:hypothetical protein
MDKLSRRAMVRGILCGAAVVGVGLTLPPGVAEAMPIERWPRKRAGWVNRGCPVEHTTLAAWQYLARQQLE